jgi:glutamine synthetase adenylyltransferase
MIIDEREILARLQNGEDAEAIANEMADILNNVNRQYQEMNSRVQKRESLQSILDLLRNWVKEYYNLPDAATNFGFDADVLIDSMDHIAHCYKNLNFNNAAADEDPLNKFLAAMGW